MEKFTDGGLVALAERNRVKNSKIDIWNTFASFLRCTHYITLMILKTKWRLNCLKEKENKTYRKNFMVDEDRLVDYKKEIRILEY